MTAMTGWPIWESGLQNEIRADGKFNGVVAERQFIKEVPRRNREPIVGVVELVRPIEL
jgi:hypothetical protein